MVEVLGLSAEPAGVCLCLFVQAFPAFGDPIPVSGFFFFLFFLSASSKLRSGTTQQAGEKPRKVKSRDGKLRCSSVALPYRSPGSCSSLGEYVVPG